MVGGNRPDSDRTILSSSRHQLRQQSTWTESLSLCLVSIVLSNMYLSLAKVLIYISSLDTEINLKGIKGTEKQLEIVRLFSHILHGSLSMLMTIWSSFDTKLDCCTCGFRPIDLSVTEQLLTSLRFVPYLTISPGKLAAL